jgi:hypothetical protein
METYESGGHAYHTTLPTDALTVTRNVMLESRAYGFEKLKKGQLAIVQSLIKAGHLIHSATSLVTEFSPIWWQGWKPPLSRCSS